MSNSTTLSEGTERTRWYLCKKTMKPSHWECERQGNDYVIDNNSKSLFKIAVPVPSFLPVAMDFMIINNALKQTFEVKK
jgi:hypothetical protein